MMARPSRNPIAPGRPFLAHRLARLLALGLACAAIGPSLPTAARAATAPSPAEEQAARAREAYAAGDFAAASEGFQRAYQLDPRPEYLYNAGRAEHRALRLDAAEALYRRVIGHPHDNPVMIERTRSHLAELQNLRAALQRAEAAGRSAAAEQARRDAAREQLEAPQARAGSAAGGRSTSAGANASGSEASVAAAADAASARTLAWVGLGAGTAGVGVGGWLLVSALLRQRDLDERTAGSGPIVGYPYDSYRGDQQAIWARRRWGAVSAGVGVALVGYAGYRLLQSAPTRAVVLPTPGGAAFAVAF